MEQAAKIIGKKWGQQRRGMEEVKQVCQTAHVWCNNWLHGLQRAANKLREQPIQLLALAWRWLAFCMPAENSIQGLGVQPRLWCNEIKSAAWMCDPKMFDWLNAWDVPIGATKIWTGVSDVIQRPNSTTPCGSWLHPMLCNCNSMFFFSEMRVRRT